MSQRTWEAVHDIDPDYAEQIASRLIGLFLIVNEAAVFKLHNASREGEGRYRFSSAEPIMPARKLAPAQVRSLRDLVAGATQVEITDGVILTNNVGQRYYEVDPRTPWVDDPCVVEFA